MTFYWILFMTIGFLSGSILYSKIIPKIFLHKDVCNMSDDGNPGAFNVFKHCGKVIGTVCLLLDVLKGFVPVLLASILLGHNSPMFSLIVLSPMLGHAVGAFNRFHGGKGIAVSFGIMIGLLPITWIPLAILAVLYILFSTAIKITPNTKRSIIVYILFGISSCIALSLCNFVYVAIGCFMISVITVCKHLKGLIPPKGAEEYEK